MRSTSGATVKIVLAALVALPIASARGLWDVSAAQHPSSRQFLPDSSLLPLYDTLFEVVVTAPRLTVGLRENPAATSVVGHQCLSNMPRSIAVDEALRFVPGVRVENQANGERVHMSVRGQGILTERGIRGIKVILDELPLNDPSGFAPDLYDVDYCTVDHVEVLRGVAASLYGTGSSAGIVSLYTKPGNSAPVGCDIATSFGSNKFWKAHGGIGGTAAGLNYRISLSRAMGDGYRMHTKFQGDNFYGKVEWDVASIVHLRPILSWSDYFNENAEGLNINQVQQDPRLPNPDALTYNEYQRTKRVTGGVSGMAEIADRQRLTFNGYLRRTVYTESVPSSVQHRDFVTPGATLQYTLQHGEGIVQNQVSLGTDVQWQSIDEYRRKNLGGAQEGDVNVTDQMIDQRGLGLFLIDPLKLGSLWGVMASVRYDNITMTSQRSVSSPTRIFPATGYHRGPWRRSMQMSEKAGVMALRHTSPGTRRRPSHSRLPIPFQISNTPVLRRSMATGCQTLRVTRPLSRLSTACLMVLRSAYAMNRKANGLWTSRIHHS